MFSIIISGAFRNFAETWPKNKIFFDNSGEPYVVFVHTWRQNYVTPRKVYKDRNWKGLTFDIHPKKYQEETFEVNEELVKSVIPEAIILVEDFHADAVREQYEIPPKSQTLLHQNFLNSVAMYQGISRGFKMALEKPEIQSSTKFIRLRTDFLIDGHLDVLNFDKDIYFAGPGIDPGFGYVSDQFFMCSKPIAEIVSQCETRLLSYVKSHGWGASTTTPFYGERILSFMLKDYLNQELSQCEPIIGRIKRPEITKDRDIKTFEHFLTIVNHNRRVIWNYILVFLIKQKAKIKR